MNIKSLMLGSAAALVAVTGARAADPIIAVEADPVEYVRVCDVYGTGFFYIPGTETCLQLSGYVRLRYEVVGEQENVEGDDYTAGSRVRARLNFDAREETEYGTLRGFVRLQGTNRFGGAGGTFIDDDGVQRNVSDDSVGDGDVGVDLAYIQLGGLTVGYLDSLWAERDGLLTDTDWSVGDFKANRVSYTFTSEGFSAAVSVEDDATGDFAPNVVGQLAYESGFFSAYVSGVYDEQSDIFISSINGVDIITPDIFDDDNNDDGAFAVKAGASLKDLVVEGSELKVEGHYAFDPTIYASFDYVTSFGSYGTDNQAENGIPIESQIGLGYSQAVGPFGVAVSGVFGETFDVYASDGFGGVDNLGSTEFYALGLNVGYEITSNFSILGEVTYRDLDLPEAADDFDQTAGFIEVLRTF